MTESEIKEEYIENIPYDEIVVGRQAKLTHVFTQQDAEIFTAVSGDAGRVLLSNLCHTRQASMIPHGLWVSPLVSSILETLLPGPGTVCLEENLIFKKNVYVGDAVTIKVVVESKKDHKVLLKCYCIHSSGSIIADGTVLVKAPKEKIRALKPEFPELDIYSHDEYHAIIDKCKSIGKLKTAVVYPVQAKVLEAVMDAVHEHLIDPVLIGPASIMKTEAEKGGLDISSFEIIDIESAKQSAEKAVELAVQGKVSCLMKGSLHSDEILGAVVKSTSGLRTTKRISHVFVIDPPHYHKSIMVTDAAINIAPDLDTKVHICQNAIDLWHAVYGEKGKLPKVAILGAVETVNTKMQATLDAASLCKMADRKQIINAILDGPLAFDNAISKQAAVDKGITSDVSGDADILVVPNIETGNVLAKQLSFLGHADAAGIVLGAKVPIILTSRADNLRARLMSCALALLFNHFQTKDA